MKHKLASRPMPTTSSSTITSQYSSYHVSRKAVPRNYLLKQNRAQNKLWCEAKLAEKPTGIINDRQPNPEIPGVSIPMESKATKTLPRVVVLGSGWAAASFVKSLPHTIRDKYEVLVLSPRNYFLYTPLLPAVATGTMEERSIVEPIRHLLEDKGDYYEAVCKSIDPERKELVACFPADMGLDSACFKINYDVLVVTVGCVNNTFGTPGVDQYCNFFKSLEDAHKLRARVNECFERAALPGTLAEERKKLLSLVVVGGGPTGVEVAAELYDMVHDDLSRLYPQLVKEVTIRMVELSERLLPTYHPKTGDFTVEVFERVGIHLLLKSRVIAVRDGYVKVITKEGEEVEVPFGACVWATGLAVHPLVKDLQQKVPGQKHPRGLLTDEYLRVKGTGGSIFALGDVALVDPPHAADVSEELWAMAKKDSSGCVSIKEVKRVLQSASGELRHLRPYADGRSTLKLADDAKLTEQSFKEALAMMDMGIKALPPTAQVARQEGEYLASLFTHHPITGEAQSTSLDHGVKPFEYHHKGSLAYVGQDQAVMDVPNVGPLHGRGVGFIWKAFETFSQFSLRNFVLVSLDWSRTKMFGRDISNV